LGSALFNELLEALQAAFYPPRNHAEFVTNALDDPFGVVAEDQGHARLLVREPVEEHGTRILRSAGAVSGDALIGNPLRDHSVRVLLLAADACAPVQALVV